MSVTMLHWELFIREEAKNTGSGILCRNDFSSMTSFAQPEKKLLGLQGVGKTEIKSSTSSIS